MSAPLIDSDNSDKIYDILIEECGATEDLRENFRIVLQANHCGEFRFCGALGFGGKFYNNFFEWRVGYYSEDRGRDRDKMVKEANKKLEALRLQLGIGESDA